MGHIPTARFNVSMTFGGDWSDDSKELLKDSEIEFSLTSINLPTMRGNYEQVYFDTMPVEVFKNFTYDPDFSMTVICDNAGKIYREFLKLIQHDKDNVVDDKDGKFDIDYEGNYDFKQKVDPDISLTVTALPDFMKSFSDSETSLNKVMKIQLAGVYIKGIGNLDFANNSSEIATFSVNASATSFEIIHEDSTVKIFNPGAYKPDSPVIPPKRNNQQGKNNKGENQQIPETPNSTSDTPEFDYPDNFDSEDPKPFANREAHETLLSEMENSESGENNFDEHVQSNIPKDSSSTMNSVNSGDDHLEDAISETNYWVENAAKGVDDKEDHLDDAISETLHWDKHEVDNALLQTTIPETGNLQFDSTDGQDDTSRTIPKEKINTNSQDNTQKTTLKKKKGVATAFPRNK